MAIVFHSATASTLNKIVVGFNQANDSITAADVTPDKWTIAVTGGVTTTQPVAAIGCIPGTVSGGFGASLFVATQMTPGGQYSVTFGGTALSITAPSTTPTLGQEWSHGLLRSITRAFAEEIQYTAGSPVTLLVQPLGFGETSIFVESTLGFPDSGKLFIRDRLYTYTAKTDVSFTGAATTSSTLESFPKRTEVHCNVAAILPS
jgi:hypothetical protein